jgi:hypothetical protein
VLNEWLARHKQFVIAGGVVMALTLLGVVLARNGQPDELAGPGTPTTQPVLATTSTGEGPSSEVPPIDCSGLITYEEAQAALGVPEHPERAGGGSELDSGETCRDRLSSDEAYFVEIGPGGPSDFEPGAVLIGVTGHQVDGPGDEALWFGGPDSEGGGAYGELVVRQNTQYGVLYFRILVGRPDADESAQQELALGLASRAMPRFPGVEVVKPEPVVFNFPEEPAPDDSHLSLADNLLTKESLGEWTRGEGLAATLAVMAGEADTSTVLGSRQLIDRSATAIIELAREYLENGDDPEMQVEVGRLLDLLTFAPEELELMTATAGRASGLLVSSAALFVVDAPNGCDDIGKPTPCLERTALPDRNGVPSGKYSLMASLDDNDAWTDAKLIAVAEGILDTAVAYEALIDMPRVTVILLSEGGSLYVDYRGPECILYVKESIAEFPDSELKQILAREMAFCLTARKYNDLIRADQVGTAWWSRGLVNYLSGYVYPSVNLEHQTLPAVLAESELYTNLLGRTWTNWILFEYLHPLLGVEGVLDMIASFPIGGDHAVALASQPDMEDLYHGFALGLTDANIRDQGLGTVPYTPLTWELPLSEPLTTDIGIPALGVRRIHVTVPDGLHACITTFETGDQRVSRRPGAPGQPGTWEQGIPGDLEGESMLVITSTRPGALIGIEVTDVSDNPDCEESQDPNATPTTLGECDLCGPSRYYWN